MQLFGAGQRARRPIEISHGLIMDTTCPQHALVHLIAVDLLPTVIRKLAPRPFYPPLADHCVVAYTVSRTPQPPAA